MSTTPTDLYAISMDELRRLASQPQPEPANDTVSEPPAEPQPEVEWSSEQPRDEQGRFVARDPEQPTEESETDEEIIVRDEIDLGDGSGVQVFEGVGANEAEARADQVAKLLEAQKNATKKIRELSHRPEPQLTVPSAEEEFILGQRILNEPSTVLKEIIKREFGMDPAEAKRRLEVAAQVERDRAENEASQAFITANPDFYACKQNGDRITKFMKLNGLEGTTENIQRAYDELKADGLIVEKPAAGDPPAARPRSSGISVRRTSPPPPPKSAAELEREAYEMPLDELRKRIYSGR